MVKNKRVIFYSTFTGLQSLKNTIIRNTRVSLIIFFLLVIFSPVYILADEQEKQYYDIKGFVIDDETGEALPYANVLLKGTNRGSTTNTDGYFVVVNAPAGTCTLQVHYIGYATQESIVDNSEEQKTTLIKMEQSALKGEGVTVFAEEYQIWKTAQEVAQVTFSPRQLTSLPSLGEVDIFRSLQLLPGISGVSDGSAGLYIRGGTPDQNLVILDGMTVYHVDHFFGFFSTFNADAVKDVQVYKGGYPAKYGGRLSSVVDLTGKTGDVNRTRFGLGVNLLSANILFEQPIFKNRGSFILSARRSYTDIIQSPLYNKLFDFITNEEATRTIGGGFGGFAGRGQITEEVRPDFYFYDVNSKLSFTPTTRDNIALSFYIGQDNIHDLQELTGVGFRRTLDSLQQAQTGTRGRDKTTDWGNLGLSFKWAHRWHDRLSTNLLVAGSNYFSKHKTDLSFNIDRPDSSQVFRGGRTFASQEDNNIQDLTLRLDNEWHVHDSHQAGAGVWISKTETDYLATFNDTLDAFKSNKKSLQASLYLQDKWLMSSNWDLTLGFRGTYYDKTQSYYFEPRFALQYTFWDVLKLKGAWGQYNQYIHRIVNEDVLEGSRDFWLVADENLKPGFAEHTILGLGYETTDYLFEVEAYHKDMDNLLEFSRRFRDQANYGGLFFFGSGISQGIEFLAQKKNGHLNGWLSYTIGEVENTFPNLNKGEPFPANHSRTHEVKFVSTYSLGRWNLSATWVYATGQPYTSPEGQYYIELLDGTVKSYYHVGDKNGYRLPDYHRMDISASYRFSSEYTYGWKAEVGLSIFNLYDHTNVWYRKYDLDVAPIIITDVTMLGFTPTIYLKVNL